MSTTMRLDGAEVAESATPRPAALATLGTAAVAVAAAAIAPGITRFVPPCPVHSMTGLDCPGCGTTRAVLALTRGDLVAAFGHNAFMVASIPLLAIVWVCWYRTRRPGATWPAWLRSTVPLALWAGAGIAFAVARNLPVPFFEPLRP